MFYREFLNYPDLTEEELISEKENILIEKKLLLKRIEELEDELVAIEEVRYRKKSAAPVVVFYDLDE